MPTYDFDCESCGSFTALRKIAERDDPIDCPTCNRSAQRIFTGVPFFGSMSNTTRTMHATNERSANEPRSTSMGHGMQCRCCSGASKSKSSGNLVAPASQRPWMVSH